MPQKLLPKCSQCDKTESLLWRNLDEDEKICNDCYELNKDNLKNELEPDSNNDHSNNVEERKTRKSTRTTRYKAKNTQLLSKTIPKVKSRRCIFKKTPFKTPTATATTATVDNLFYKGTYLQVGDIVSMMDTKDNFYYGQIKALLVDTYCEKSAFITWLLPTKASPPPNEQFDPSTYIIGPEEDFPRKLSCMEFVMHAPSTYFYDKDSPYPTPDICHSYGKTNENIGFIWTNMANTM